MSPKPLLAQSKSGLIRRFPLLVLFLSAGAVVTAWVAWDFYLQDVEMREQGFSVRKRSFMVLLAGPGIMSLYVVGTLTNSFVLSWVAFAVGMTSTYGGVGLAMDFVVKGMGRIARCLACGEALSNVPGSGCAVTGIHSVVGRGYTGGMPTSPDNQVPAGPRSFRFRLPPPRYIALVSVVLIALMVGDWRTEQRMTPVPALAGDAERMDKIPHLRAHIRRLLDEMKSGHLVGASASRFREEMDMADHVDDRGNFATYRFFGIPETAAHEGSPELVIAVQKKFDLVVHCAVVVPEY